MTLWNPRGGFYRLLKIGRNRLSLAVVVDDDDYRQQVAWWLNGKILGRYVSVNIPWRRQLPGSEQEHQ